MFVIFFIIDFYIIYLNSIHKFKNKTSIKLKYVLIKKGVLYFLLFN